MKTRHLSWLLLSAAATAQPLILLDTDYRTDVDDVGTLAMIHGLEDEGLIQTLGVIASTAGPSVVGAIDAVNTYYDRPDLPIGLIRSDLATAGGDEYAPVIGNTANFPSDQANAGAPDSAALYRSLLNSAADGSVTIVVVGGQKGVHEFMRSPANYNGDGIALTGMELIESKVAELVIMGGRFNDPAYAESNIKRGITEAREVAEEWPTDIIYSGWEVGTNVNTGAELNNPGANPVAKAYEVFSGSGGAGVIGNRASWDQTAALYAGVGLAYKGTTLWTLSAPHDISFDAQGRTLFAANPEGNHFYLIETLPKPELASIISDLMTTRQEDEPDPGVPGDDTTFAHYTFEETTGTIVNQVDPGGPLDMTNTQRGGGAGGWGAAGAPGFGTAFDILASGDGTYNSTVAGSSTGGGLTTAAPVEQLQLQSADGAFTYEALVNLKSGINSEQTVVAHDGPNANRGFLFRVASDGTLSLYTGTQEVKAPIPTSGDHAFEDGKWFHVAVAYTGAGGVAGNTTFYWTKLESGATAANPLATVTLNADIPASTNPLGIGTSTRAPYRFQIRGLLDEVRLSSYALGASDFPVFAGVIDGDNDGMPDAWESLYGLDPTIAATDEEDSDQDGIPDLMEYALGLDPSQPSRQGLPVADMETGFLMLEINRNPDATHLSYQAEVSGGLGGWDTGAAHVTILEDTPALLRVRDNVAISAATRRFMRLKVAP